MFLCVGAVFGPAALVASALRPLEITSQFGHGQSKKSHQFLVQVARTPQQQKQGLMFVRDLPPMTGMIFLFAPPRPARFWMRNTFIPLDMIFIAPDGRISKIATRRDTQSDALTISPAPVAAVLEIAAGEALRLGITIGDKVHSVAIDFSNK